MRDVAVVGCGFMGRNHAHAISDHPMLCLTSVVDLDKNVAESVADKYGASNVYTDFEHAIEEAETIVVATPETVHAEQAHTVIDYDRHLLLEKPVTIDTNEAWALADRAADRDAVTGVSFILRYDPEYAGLQAAVADGKVGESVSVRAKRAITRSESERIGERGHPLYYMNIHDIDAMRWCVDNEVTRVSAVERRGELDDIDVPDTVHATLTFEDGTVGMLTSHGILPDDTPGGISADLELVGTDGTATVNTPGTTLTINGVDDYDRPDVRHWPVVNGRMDGAVRRQIDHFADSIADCGGLLASLHDGARAQAVADAILEATERGKFYSVTYQ